MTDLCQNTKGFRKRKRDFSYSETNTFLRPHFSIAKIHLRVVPLIIRACAIQYFDFLKISHWIQRRRRFFLKWEKAEWSTHGEFRKKFTVQEYPVFVPILQFEWWKNSSGKMYQQERIAHMRSISYFAKNIVSGLNWLSCWKGSASIVSSVQSSSRHISRLFARRNNINGSDKVLYCFSSRKS